MVRLPTVGGDSGNWGTILNEFLNQEHDTDGTHGTITPTDIKAQGPWVDVRNYASINAAVTAIGSDSKMLLIPNEQTLTASLTVPSNIHIIILKSGSIVKASTYTLTINGPFEAGLYKVFSGFSVADITFAVNTVREVYPEWWGAVADGSTDNINFINSALASSDAPHITFSRGQYNFTGPINHKSGAILEGTSHPTHSTTLGTRLHNIGGSGLDAIYINSTFKAQVKNMQITATSLSRYGININGSLYSVIEDVIVGNYSESVNLGHGSHGIRITGNSYYTTLNRVTSRMNYGRGIDITATSNATFINDSHIQGNALDGIYVDDSYMITGNNLDISTNGSGTPSPTGGGTAGYGLRIEGTSHACGFEYINYEVNGNSNKVYVNLDSGAYKTFTFNHFTGDDIYFDIVAGNWVNVANLSGNNTSIVFGATNTDYGSVINPNTTTTVTNNGGDNFYILDANTGNSYGTIASAAEIGVGSARVHLLTGTTNITSIAATSARKGKIVTFIFAGILTVSDGNNLKLAGNFTTTADDTLTLVCDGTNWYEISRSVN